MRSTSKLRLVPAPVWEPGSSPEPMAHNGEQLVWQLLHTAFAQMAGVEILYEQVLYPKLTKRGMRPDGLVRLLFYRLQLHVEVCDSKSTWGKGKKERMAAIERRYGIPVLYINRPMLRRLGEPDAVEVLSDWFYHVLFKHQDDYGKVITPNTLLKRSGIKTERTEPTGARKAHQREVILDYLTAPEPAVKAA